MIVVAAGEHCTGCDDPGSSLLGVQQGCSVDYTVIDQMFEQALAGPMAGPLLRLFLAQYLRFVIRQCLHPSLSPQ